MKQKFNVSQKAPTLLFYLFVKVIIRKLKSRKSENHQNQKNDPEKASNVAIVMLNSNLYYILFLV